MLTGTIHHPTARERGREDKERKKEEEGVAEVGNTFRKENDHMIGENKENNREIIREGYLKESTKVVVFLFYFWVVAEWRKRQRCDGNQTLEKFADKVIYFVSIAAVY